MWRSENNVQGSVSFLPTCGFWGLNLGHQPGQQAPLPAEPFHSSLKHILSQKGVHSGWQGCVVLSIPKVLRPWQPFARKDGAEILLSRTQHGGQILAERSLQTHKLPLFTWLRGANLQEKLYLDFAFLEPIPGYPKQVYNKLTDMCSPVDCMKRKKLDWYFNFDSVFSSNLIWAL